MAIPAVRMNHAVLYVTDSERSKQFWTSALDMEVVAEVPQARAVFLKLRYGSNDHDLGLFGVGEQGQTVGRPPGLYHLAWQVDTIDELVAARKTLTDLGALVGQSSHGTTKSLYGRDPDGIEFEIMWMLPRSEWAQFDQQAIVEPIDFDEELQKWSGVGTAHELVPATRST
ncbi:MAG: VOC family protein [Acidimicrobiales bacterium]|nr:VOC family protein [Acidimicrobiales bacterium]